jgi:toxin ParE1/3/4
MAKVVWSESALEALDEIADFIAGENADAANRLVRRVFGATDLLAGFPELGRVPRELAGLPYRELVVRPLRVFYLFDRERELVRITWVMRGERQFEMRMLLESELKNQGIDF